jgi:hypothetical protein
MEGDKGKGNIQRFYKDDLKESRNEVFRRIVSKLQKTGVMSYG